MHIISIPETNESETPADSLLEWYKDFYAFRGVPSIEEILREAKAIERLMPKVLAGALKKGSGLGL